MGHKSVDWSQLAQDSLMADSCESSNGPWNISKEDPVPWSSICITGGLFIVSCKPVQLYSCI